MNRYWKMKLVCLTPVHIGNGVSYNPSQYIYEPGSRGGSIYFLNESKWLKYLYEKKVIDLFARELLDKINRGASFSIYDWLISKRNLGPIDKIMQELQERGAVYPKETVYLDFGRRTQKNSLNDVHPFIRSGNGECYVPGSSIKGVIRTALLVRDMKRHPEKYKSYWQKASHALLARGGRNPVERDLQYLANDIETVFAYTPQAIAEARSKNKRVDMVNDLFKFLQVSDAVSDNTSQMGIVQKVDMGIRAAETGEKPKTMPVCRECILSGNTLHFTVSIDDAALKQIGVGDAEDILEALKDFAGLQYDLQADIFANGAANELVQLGESNFVLGGGTGYFSKTILYALAVSQAKNFKEGREAGVNIVRAFMKEKFSRGHHERDNKLAPHTLKLTRCQNKTMMMGLCKVEVEQELC